MGGQRDADDQEQDGVEHEREQVPEPMQLSALQAAGPASVSRHHYTSGHDRHDTRRVDDVGAQVGAVGDDQRGQDLELGVFDEAQKKHGDAAGGKPDRRADGAHEDEAQPGIRQRRVAGQDGAQHGGKDGNPGAVIEKAFTVEDGFQPSRRSKPPQHADHRDGIGGGHDAALVAGQGVEQARLAHIGRPGQHHAPRRRQMLAELLPALVRNRAGQPVAARLPGVGDVEVALHTQPGDFQGRRLGQGGHGGDHRVGQGQGQGGAGPAQERPPRQRFAGDDHGVLLI